MEKEGFVNENRITIQHAVTNKSKLVKSSAVFDPADLPIDSGLMG